MAVLLPEIGHAVLLVALALAAYGAFAAVRAATTVRSAWLGSARNAAAAHFILVTAAAVALEYLLVTSDLSVRYVANVSTSASPLRYKIAGLWGALEGSILLWEWLQGLNRMRASRKPSTASCPRKNR